MIFKRTAAAVVSTLLCFAVFSCLKDAEETEGLKLVPLPENIQVQLSNGESIADIFAETMGHKSTKTGALTKAAAPLLFDEVRAITSQWSEFQHGDFTQPQMYDEDDWSSVVTYYAEHPAYNILSNTVLERDGNNVTGEVVVGYGSTTGHTSTDLLVMFFYRGMHVAHYSNYYTTASEWSEEGWGILGNTVLDTAARGDTAASLLSVPGGPTNVADLCTVIFDVCTDNFGYQDVPDCETTHMLDCQDPTVYFRCMTNNCGMNVCADFTTCETRCRDNHCAQAGLP